MSHTAALFYPEHGVIPRVPEGPDDLLHPSMELSTPTTGSIRTTVNPWLAWPKHCYFILFSPLLLLGAQAADKYPPFHSAMAFQASYSQLASQSSCSLGSFPFPLGVPFQGLSGDVCDRFSLRTWLIQLHILFRICKSMGSRLVLFHRSTLLTSSFRQMSNMTSVMTL